MCLVKKNFNSTSCCSIYFPGKSGPFKVVKWLRRRYKDPKPEEKALFLTRAISTQTDFSKKSVGTQTNMKPKSLYLETGLKLPLAKYPEFVQQIIKKTKRIYQACKGQAKGPIHSFFFS